MPAHLQLYYITDRKQIKNRSLESCIADAIAAGVDWVQIREKDLPARRLLALVDETLARARGPEKTRVMVNDRLDVAIASKAHGVHLGTHSMPADSVRKLAPPELVVGVSCHSLEEALSAQAAGANYLLLGPIFETPSKIPYGPPLGLSKLREITRQISIPVFALGGITLDRVVPCQENGAAGIAGIRMFQDCDSLVEMAKELRGHIK